MGIDDEATDHSQLSMRVAAPPCGASVDCGSRERCWWGRVSAEPRFARGDGAISVGRLGFVALRWPILTFALASRANDFSLCLVLGGLIPGAGKRSEPAALCQGPAGDRYHGRCCRRFGSYRVSGW